MAIQVRRGNEADFDASKMLPGEWAVSLDTKYVRMCFSPGIVLRMASYESFEADMELIQDILEECEEIQTAIERIKSEIDEKASLTIEYSNSASLSATRASEEADRAHVEAERAKNYADSAQSATNVQIATKDTAGIIKGGDNYIAEDGTLTLIVKTTETTMPNSCEGRLLFKEIRGKTEQDSTSGKNLLNPTLQTTTKNGVTCTRNSDGTYTLNGTATAKAEFTVFYNSNGAFNGKRVKGVGCPKGGSDASYKAWFTDVTVRGENDLGNGAILTPSTNELKYIIEIGNGYTCNNLLFKPMVTTDLEATYDDFEPYTGGIPSPNPSYPQEIKSVVISGIKTHGKQLLNYDVFKTIGTMNGTSVFENNGVTITATNRDAYTFYHANDLPEELKIPVSEGEEITLSWELDSDVVGRVFIFENGNAQANVNTSANDLKLTHKVGSGTYFVTVRFGVTNAGDTISYKNIMLNKGGEALPYEPYCGSSFTFSNPIELNKIGDVQDVIGGGKVKRRCAIKRNPTFNLASGYRVGNSEMFAFTTLDGANKSVVMSNKLPYKTSSELLYNDMTGAYQLYNNIYMRIQGVSDVSEFTRLMADSVFIYELAEETTEALPTADQVALNSIATYDGITYLEFDSPLQPEFVAEYGTSKVGGVALESLLVARNNEIRISALETSAVNNI